VTAGLTEELICSASGCRTTAEWKLLWNNPRIHEPERRKIWLACEEHKESLSEFLNHRSFLKETEPLLVDSEPGSAADR